MSSHTFVYQHQNLDQIVKDYVGPLLAQTKVLFLFGDLGAGKTTLCRTILRQLFNCAEVTSPTFTYLNVYKIDTQVIYHFDLYRLENFAQFVDLGLEKYFLDPEAICIVEWPEVIEPFWPLVVQVHKNIALLRLEHVLDQNQSFENSRQLTIEFFAKK